MKTRLLLTVFANVVATSLHATSDEKIALVNGTLINPGTAQVMRNALVIIEGDHISAVGDQATAISTKSARIIDCRGKFILPGYIDTHV
jgi:imidazolonepropionase-like amidohydrolase